MHPLAALAGVGAPENTTAGQALQEDGSARSRQIQGLGDIQETQQAENQEQVIWHKVTALPLHDPETGQQMVLVVQADVTARTELEKRLMRLTEAQLIMLEAMFPR